MADAHQLRLRLARCGAGSHEAGHGRVSETLLREQIKVHAFSRYYLGAPAKTGLIFGYGAVDPAQIRQGFSALRRLLAR